MAVPRVLAIVDRRALGDRWLDVLAALVAAAPPDVRVVARVDGRTPPDERALALARAWDVAPGFTWHGTTAEAAARGAPAVHWPGWAPWEAAGDLPVTASVHTLDDVVRAAAAGAEAVLFGPVFPPGTKPVPGVGVDALAAFVRASPLPVLAVGGVDLPTLPRLAGTGIVGVGVVGALTGPDPVGAVLAVRDACLRALSPAPR